jgi:hypothetical protein
MRLCATVHLCFRLADPEWFLSQQFAINAAEFAFAISVEHLENLFDKELII